MKTIKNKLDRPFNQKGTILDFVKESYIEKRKRFSYILKKVQEKYPDIEITETELQRLIGK